MKPNKLYDIQALDHFPAQLLAFGKQHFGDSAYSGVVLERSLTHVDPTVLEAFYPELAFMNSGIEADNSGGYAERIQSLRVTDQGQFTLSSDRAEKGDISLGGEQGSILVYEKSAKARWSETDVQQAALQNISLPSRLLSAGDRIYKRELDEIGLIGVGDNKGLLNHASFTSGAASGAVATLTGKEMYEEIADLITSQWNSVNNIPEFKANRVMMPDNVMTIMSRTILKDEAGSDTVMTALRRNFPEVEFLNSYRCRSVSGSSVTAAFATNRFGLRFRLPTPLKVGEMYKEGSFDFAVDFKYRVAGLDVLEPAACYLLTGL